MDTLKDILLSRNNVINDNKYISNNDNNDIHVSSNQFALNRDTFTPNTPETTLAEEIALKLDDLNNYACYLNVVNTLGHATAYRLLQTTIDDIKSKERSSYPVRNKARYFMWLYKTSRY